MVWRCLKKLGIKPPYDPVIPLLGIYPEETKIEKDTGIPFFIAALFTVARTWKQPRCPLTDEWIKKLWYIYTMEYYSAKKMNSFESILMRWMNLEPIIQSEVSQKKKDKYHYQFSSLAQVCPTLCNPMNRRPPCPSPTPGVYSNSCPLSWWCHPTISSSVIPFSSHLRSFLASGSFQ